MPQSRFNRDFELIVGVDGGQQVTVRPPFRITFSADKSVVGGLNKMTVRVYNLKESSRQAIAKDPEQVKRIPISLSVGYDGRLGLIFKGTVHKASNRRSGAEVITEMECLDGGFDFLNSFTARTVRGNQNAVDAVLDDMPNTDTGKLAPVPELIRPRVLVGTSALLIDQLVGPGQSWYIDDEQLFIVGDDDVVSGLIPVVNAATGLLNVPEREMQRVTFSTVMNPALRIAGLCRLESTVAPQMDGIYRIDTMGYSGDYEGNDWSQQCQALPAPEYRLIR